MYKPPGAYIWRGLYMEGLFFGILGYSEVESKNWNLVHQTLSANRASTMFDVCERLVTFGQCCSHFTG